MPDIRPILPETGIALSETGIFSHSQTNNPSRRFRLLALLRLLMPNFSGFLPGIGLQDIKYKREIRLGTYGTYGTYGTSRKWRISFSDIQCCGNSFSGGAKPPRCAEKLCRPWFQNRFCFKRKTLARCVADQREISSWAAFRLRRVPAEICEFGGTLGCRLCGQTGRSDLKGTQFCAPTEFAQPTVLPVVSFVSAKNPKVGRTPSGSGRMSHR